MQTNSHLKAGEEIAIKRHLAQSEIDFARRKENSIKVKAQIEENKRITEKLKQEDLNKHLKNL